MYIDLLFIINYLFDLLILQTINVTLKRNINFKRLLLGSLVGSLSIIILFININILIFKLFLSFIIIIVSFGYKDHIYFFKNILYFYFISILLGGFIYYLKVEFNINSIIKLLLGPIIIYIFLSNNKDIKRINSFYYNVSFKYNNKIYNYNAYLDSGNTLTSPYSNKPVIILYAKNFKINNPLFIPYHTVNYNGLLKSFKTDIYINNKLYKNIIIALSNNKINIDGVNILLNKDIF